MMESDAKDKLRFANWLRSLALPEAEGLTVESFSEALTDGILLLKVVDLTRPGSVDWSKVNWNSQNNFKKLANCNLAVSCIQQTIEVEGLVRGKDIVDKTEKAVLSLLWVLMREYFSRNHGVKSEEQFKEIANQYLPLGTEGFIAAVQEEDLDSEPLMIVLYYGDEGEIFMTFHDESKLDCSLLPQNFDQLVTCNVPPTSPISFTINSHQFKKCKSKSKMVDETDNTSATMEEFLIPSSLKVERKMITQIASEDKIAANVESPMKNPILHQTYSIEAFNNLVNFVESEKEMKKSYRRNKLEQELVETPSSLLEKTAVHPTIMVNKCQEDYPNVEAFNDKHSTMSSRLYSHRKRVMNVLGPIDQNKAKSYNKPQGKVSDRSRSPLVSKIEACYSSVGAQAIQKKHNFKDCENLNSPASTDYYLSCNANSVVPTISKFDKATRESVLLNKSPTSHIRAKNLMDEVKEFGARRIEEFKTLTENMTTFLFILSSKKLQNLFTKPLEEYFNTKNYNNFRVGDTRHTTPFILKIGQQHSQESLLKLNKANMFFEAEVSVPCHPHVDDDDGKSTFSEVQAKVAAVLELQKVSISISSLLAEFSESAAKKALVCVSNQLEELATMPTSVTESLFQKIMKIKDLKLKEKIGAKRIEGLIRSLQKLHQDQKKEKLLFKYEVENSNYLPPSQANKVTLEGLKQKYKVALKQRVLSGLASESSRLILV